MKDVMRNKLANMARERFTKHGMSKTRVHSIWRGIVNRCSNSNSPAYINYGGRGITICRRWNTFVNFWEDMKNGYADNLTIDRIDNNGNYEPNNCRWVTRKIQNNNSRNNRILELNGNKKTLSQWAETLGVKVSTLSMRIDHYGWSVERALC